MLGDISMQTAKERRFYARKLREGRTKEHVKVARFVANMSVREEKTEEDATQTYIRASGEARMKVTKFDTTKIKPNYKLDNSMLMALRKKTSSDNGLRYYSRG